MFKTLTTAFALTGLLATASFASDAPVPDDVKLAITTKLTEQGYTVGKIKREDGMFEAYARKDGKKYEVYLNADMEIVRTKED